MVPSPKLAALAPVIALLLLPALAAARTGTGPGGYVWKDCEEPDGPTCNYEIRAVSDGLTGLCSDEIYAPPGGLGFSFPFYGTTFSSFFMSANGVIYLSNRPASDAANAALTGLEGRPIIAPLWDDWAMDNDDELAFFCPDPGCANSGPITFVESYRLGTGVDPGGVAYRDIEWFDTAKHRPTCSEPETATFGLRLFADGRILFSYSDVSVAQPAETDSGISATIGISRGFLGEFTQVSFDAASIPYVPYQVLFIPPCPRLTCNSIRAPRDACEGEDVTFEANFGGGVPPVSVAWDFDGDTTPDATGNPVTRALPAGVTTVRAILGDSCASPGPSSCEMTHVINVHASPVPVITPQSSTSFCGADGESVTLLADVGYASYQWVRDGFDIPAATTRTLVANVSGSYVVRVVDAFGCEGVSAPIVVDAEDCVAGCTPLTCDDVIVSPFPACEGAQVTATVIFSGGEGTLGVAWDVDGDGTPDVTGNPMRRVFLPGATPITVTVTDTCATPGPQTCTLSDLVDVKPTPQPVITPSGPLSFCAARGESVTLDAGSGWAAHQWILDGLDLSAETARTHVASVSGAYSVRVTDANGCVGTSLEVIVVADDCPSACATLACGAITVTPAPACEGEMQRLALDVTGGEAPTGVAWDLDGDGTPDAAGNPVDVTLAPGTHRVRAVAADSCADPGPQSCESFADVVVNPGSAAIGEVSGPGDPPLLVLTKSARVEVEDVAAATSYHAYVDAIGSWWAPSDATGRRCGLASAGAGARPGTLLLDVPLPVNSWLVVVGANSCGEGVPGTSSEGVDRSSQTTWTACGPGP